MPIALANFTDLGAAARQFQTDGALLLPKLLEADDVARLRGGVQQVLHARLQPALARGLGVEKSEGFAEIVQRSAGRYDLPLSPETMGEPIERLDFVLRPLIHNLLGEAANLLLVGAVVALPGAQEQAWHTDSAHLFPETGLMLPPHCLNVFVPLVDLHRESGPTELCLGSHVLTKSLKAPYEPDPDLRTRIGHREEPVLALAPAGAGVVFDYRLLHRALPNRSPSWRPLLYLTYARGWFRDRTFPARSLMR
jgi:hypothetical protein